MDENKLSGERFTPAMLRGMETLCTGQCCSLKIETPDTRVWLCRVAGGVSIEQFDGKRWEITAGSCDAREAAVP